MSVFTHVLGNGMAKRQLSAGGPARVHKGLGTWLINRLRLKKPDNPPSLRVLEQIRVTPRQLLVLVEVEGERVLVATSDASATAFYPVNKAAAPSSRRRPATIRIEGKCA